MKRKNRSSSTSATASEHKNKKTKTNTNSNEAEVSSSSNLDMRSAEQLFASLISPITTDDFFANYWEKKPLHIQRKDLQFYGALFCKADLEVLLKKEDINYVEDLNVCRYVDGEKEFLNGDEGTRATLAKVLKDIKEKKATVQFHQPQRFKDLLWQLNGNLENLFGCLVGANVYITPPDSQGLAPHFDDVEVFVLQLEGKKHWKLYKPPTELPQDYSADLDQDSIGEPTHDINLQAGDLLYFPRGTVHQADTVDTSKTHSTHITLSTYQQNTWGDFLSTALTHAVDKAIETDVKFRSGLPINFLACMGLGMEGIEDTDKHSKGGKKKQEDFKLHLKGLLSSLVDYIDAHEAADKMASDFMASRLPPFDEARKEDSDKGKSDKLPTEESEVKFRFPEYVRVTSGDAAPSAPAVLAMSDSDDKPSDEEGEDSGDEAMEESEEETKPKKGGKGKKAASGKVKNGKEKKSGKGKKSEESEDEEAEETGKKSKKSQNETKKSGKANKGKKGKKKEESESDDEQSEDEAAKEKKKKSAASQKKTDKGKKGKTKESEEDESDEDYELGDDDSEESGDEDEDEDSLSDDDEGPWVLVHHSLNNDHTCHMVGVHEPSVLKFEVTYQEALVHLYSKRHEFIPVKSLPLDISDSMYLVNSLWSESLLDIKQ